MVKDEEYEVSKSKRCIEIRIDNIWIPAAATDLRIIDKNTDIKRVKGIRVRKLK